MSGTTSAAQVPPEQQPPRPPPQARDPNPQPRPATEQAGPSLASADPTVPGEEAALLLAAGVGANKVASRAVVAGILSAARAANASVDASDLTSLAWACYHNGSSRYTTLEGETPHGLPLAELKDLVETRCTLRQFCMYYAKICYNIGRATKTPPANWMAKGFKEDTKYAAFDFFNGVTNDAAAKPAGGLRFQPSPAEVAAHAVNATMAIVGSREAANQYSNRGNMLAMQQVRASPNPPMITFD